MHLDKISLALMHLTIDRQSAYHTIVCYAMHIHRRHGYQPRPHGVDRTGLVREARDVFDGSGAEKGEATRRNLEKW